MRIRLSLRPGARARARDRECTGDRAVGVGGGVVGGPVVLVARLIRQPSVMILSFTGWATPGGPALRIPSQAMMPNQRHPGMGAGAIPATLAPFAIDCEPYPTQMQEHKEQLTDAAHRGGVPQRHQHQFWRRGDEPQHMLPASEAAGASNRVHNAGEQVATLSALVFECHCWCIFVVLVSPGCWLTVACAGTASPPATRGDCRSARGAAAVCSADSPGNVGAAQAQHAGL